MYFLQIKVELLKVAMIVTKNRNITKKCFKTKPSIAPLFEISIALYTEKNKESTSGQFAKLASLPSGFKEIIPMPLNKKYLI